MEENDANDNNTILGVSLSSNGNVLDFVQHLFSHFWNTILTEDIV